MYFPVGLEWESISTGHIFVGAFCLDVRTFVFVQRMGFPNQPLKVKPSFFLFFFFPAGEQISPPSFVFLSRAHIRKWRDPPAKPGTKPLGMLALRGVEGLRRGGAAIQPGAPRDRKARVTGSAEDLPSGGVFRTFVTFWVWWPFSQRERERERERDRERQRQRQRERETETERERDREREET